jgi:hypothetical protein
MRDFGGHRRRNAGVMAESETPVRATRRYPNDDFGELRNGNTSRKS